MRLDIRYETRFAYAHPVRESNNEVRACPATDDRQQLVSYRLTTQPAARVLSTTDYWGTRVDAFGIRPPHRELEIVAESTVETLPARIMAAAPTMAQLADPLFREQHIEYLDRTAHVDWGPNVEAEARRRAEPLVTEDTHELGPQAGDGDGIERRAGGAVGVPVARHVGHEQPTIAGKILDVADPVLPRAHAAVEEHDVGPAADRVHRHLRRRSDRRGRGVRRGPGQR
jgi:hypothetical protein